MKTFRQFRNELLENSLYSTPQDKLDFIADNEKIVTAFLYSFIGSFTLYNKNKVKAKHYFSGDKQVQVQNINDDNNDSSLILKIMHDRNGFKNPTTVTTLTRLLAKVKTTDIDIDVDIVKTWLQDLSPTLHNAIPSDLKGYVNNFISGKTTFDKLAYVLYKKRTSYAPGEYLKLVQSIGAIPQPRDKTPKVKAQPSTVINPQISNNIVIPPVTPTTPVTPVVNATPAPVINTASPVDIKSLEPEIPVETFETYQDKKEAVKKLTDDELESIAKNVLKYIKIEEENRIMMNNSQTPVLTKVPKKVQQDYDLVSNDYALLHRLIKDQTTLTTNKKVAGLVNAKLKEINNKLSEESEVITPDKLLDMSTVTSYIDGYEKGSKSLAGSIVKCINSGYSLDKIFEENATQRNTSITNLPTTLQQGLLIAVCDPNLDLSKIGNIDIFRLMIANLQLDGRTNNDLFVSLVPKIKTCRHPEIQQLLTEQALKTNAAQQFSLKGVTDILSLAKQYSIDEIDDLLDSTSISKYQKVRAKLDLYLNSGIPITTCLEKLPEDTVMTFIKDYVSDGLIGGSTKDLFTADIRKHIFEYVVDNFDKLSDFFKDNSYAGPNLLRNFTNNVINNVNNPEFSSLITPKFIQTIFNPEFIKRDAFLHEYYNGGDKHFRYSNEAAKLRYFKTLTSSLLNNIINKTIDENSPNSADELFEAIKKYAPIPDFIDIMQNEISSIYGVYLTMKNSPIKIAEKELNPQLVQNVLEFNDIDLASIQDFKIDIKNTNSISNEIKTSISSQKDILEPLLITELDFDLVKNKKLTDSIISSSHAGRHGDTYFKILRQFEVNIPDAYFQTFKHEMIKAGTHEEVIPAFHGTGTIAANMILRYGFKIIPAGDPSVTGRMLGDGVYFATNIDKALQYVGNAGFTRDHGTIGYIFDMETELGKEKVNYQKLLAGDGVESSEWCIRQPTKQLKVIKAYEVELCGKSTMDSYLNEADTFKTFSQFNKERLIKNSNYKVYTFMDYQVITPEGKTIPSDEIKKDTFGRKIKVETFGRKTTVYIPAKTPSSIDFGRCNMLYGDELKIYLKLLNISY